MRNRKTFFHALTSRFIVCSWAEVEVFDFFIFTLKQLLMKAKHLVLLLFTFIQSQRLLAQDHSPVGVMISHGHPKVVGWYPIHLCKCRWKETDPEQMRLLTKMFLAIPDVYQSMHMDMHMIMVMYGLSSRLSFMAMAAYQKSEMKNDHVAGCDAYAPWYGNVIHIRWYGYVFFRNRRYAYLGYLQADECGVIVIGLQSGCKPANRFNWSGWKTSYVWRIAECPIWCNWEVVRLIFFRESPI